MVIANTRGMYYAKPSRDYSNHYFFLSVLWIQDNLKSIETSVQAADFEILIPYGLDHPRGKIIKSMIDNSTLKDAYDSSLAYSRTNQS